MIPYTRHWIDESDIAAVAQALRADFITTGPEAERFEADFCAYTGAKYAVAASSGTAALHLALLALGIMAGDEVIIPAISFVATSNCVLYRNAIPVFADVEEGTLCVDAARVQKAIGPRTMAIIAMDYGGLPCDYAALADLSFSTGIPLVCDACHSLGGSYMGAPVGQLGAISCFSFHPAKVMTTGEGGMATTDDEMFAHRMRQFRNHGIDKARSERVSYRYNMVNLGYNYRLSDFQCALGRNQLKRVGEQVCRRQEIAALYDAAFAEIDGVVPLTGREGCLNARHLYVVKVPERDRVFSEMRQVGVGVNVHYRPVYQHSYYRRQLGTSPSALSYFPVAERVYKQILTLPCYLGLSDDQVRYVVDMLREAVNV